MTTWIRRSLIGLGVLAALGGAAVTVGAHLGERKLARRVALPAIAPVALRSDTAAVERGRYLYASRGCADCHGQDGTGKDVIKDDGLWVRAPNITAGPGGVVGRYAPVDWVRTLRHGVKPDGRAVLIMPSEDYARLTDDDVAGIVAYVRQLPAAPPGEPARLELPLPLRIAYAAGALRDASEKIDHSLPPARAVPEGVTAEHGAYVANACIGCHGPRLSGGKIPGAPPQWPAAANLTPAADGGLARYGSAETFQAMFRTGRRPDGTQVSPVMPFQALGAMSDTDVQALYLYLKGMPARPAGG
jgi:mono/diheme cytochrome c family protein